MALTVLKTLLELLSRIKELAENVKGHFPDRTEQLRQRIQTIERHLRNIERNEDENIVQDDLESMLETFEEGAAFLEKLGQKSGNRIGQKRGWYEKEFENLNMKLNEDVLDLVLGLNADVPLEKWDDPNTHGKTDDPNPLYPPLLLDQTPTTTTEAGSSRSSEPTTGTKAEFVLIPPVVVEDNDPLLLVDDDDDDDSNNNDWTLQKEDPEEQPVIEFNPDWLPWDTSPAARPMDYGSSSNASRSAKDRRLLATQIRRLRHLDQLTPITRIRVVVARLEPGDTSPQIRAAQVVGGALGLSLGVMAAPVSFVDSMLVKGKSVEKSVQRAVTRPAAGAAFFSARFKHFLLQIDLRGGGGEDSCVLERCEDDVYLYHGMSSRQEQRTVLEMIPTQGAVLLDLVELRNRLRQNPYKLHTNDCQTFTWDVLTALEATNKFKMDEESANAFLSSIRTATSTTNSNSTRLDQQHAEVELNFKSFLDACREHYVFGRKSMLVRP